MTDPKSRKANAGSARRADAGQSRVGSRGRVSLPTPVREALGAEAGDRLVYTIEKGAVRVAKGEPAAARHDPALEPFLAMIAVDIDAHPERLRAIPPKLRARIRALLRGQGPVDLTTPIIGDVSLES